MSSAIGNRPGARSLHARSCIVDRPLALKRAASMAVALLAATAATVAEGKTALLVVGSTSLGASDAALKERLDHYYTTTVRDDSATAITKDVIVISTSVDPNTVGPKYKSVAKGVLVLEPGLFPAMNMAATSGTLAGQTRIKVVNAAHQMAGGVKLNALATVYGSAKGVGWANPPGGATKVALTADGNSSRATMFGYAAGAAMLSGFVAPARRAGYYVTSADSLTAVGWQLFDYAVDYADGNQPPVSGGAVDKITWAATVTRQAKGCGDWTPTWAANGNLYTAWGDCNGVTGLLSPKRSMGFSRVSGSPPGNLTLADIDTGPAGAPDIDLVNGGLDALGDSKNGKKPSGMLYVGNTLYAMVRNIKSADGTQSRIRYTLNYAALHPTWNWASWTFTDFGYPVFVQYGQSFAGGGTHAYVVAHDSPSAYLTADRFILMRVPIDQILDQAAWQFFSGTATTPTWVGWAQRAERKPIFVSKGRCYRNGMSFNAARGRYYWWQQLSGISRPDTRFFGGFGIYSAPNPWGPWTTAYYNEKWDVGPGEKGEFPTKWMNAAGIGSSGEMYLLLGRRQLFRATRNDRRRVLVHRRRRLMRPLDLAEDHDRPAPTPIGRQE
jgi:hypothetical protein